MPGKKEKKPRPRRGRLIFDSDLDFCFSLLGSGLFGPISQLDVLFYLAAFVPVFRGFIRSISELPERIFRGPDYIADYIQ